MDHYYADEPTDDCRDRLAGDFARLLIAAVRYDETEGEALAKHAYDFADAVINESRKRRAAVVIANLTFTQPPNCE